MAVEVRLRTDRGATAHYFMDKDAHFGDVIEKFCRDCNMEKQKTTFFIHEDRLVPEEPIEYVDFNKGGHEVFVTTEGRLMRQDFGYFVYFNGKNDEDLYAVRRYKQVPNKEELYKIASEILPGWKCSYWTKYGYRPLKGGDTGPIEVEDLDVDETGYPSTDISVLLEKGTGTGSLGTGADSLAGHSPSASIS